MSAAGRPRVLLADDHRMFAEALRTLLATEFDLVDIVDDGAAMIDAANRLRPDVIVADITMPRLNGIEALALLRKEMPDVRVVFLTMHRDVAYARRALAAGALGFVLKHSAPTELVLALHAALEGRTFITPALAGDVLRTAKQIAAKLDISARTVEFHKYTLMESVGAKNTAELLHFAIRHGIVAG
ncbi:MAG: response regulator transcription factor [Betaproteobacteria bacterium]|nr:MAG: response regulator transcription factor [Betaproteobacteria bacterium]